jgi:hypothetical protein
MGLNNLLAVDLDSLIESGNVLWVFIGTLGAGTTFSILSFIKTSISGKKFTKVSDFAVVADKNIKFGKNEMIKAKNEIVEETKKLIVEPLKQQVVALVSDNAQLASLVVSLTSYIPLPLEVKREAVVVINTLGNITEEAKKLLNSSIAYQEKQIAIEEKQSTELQDNINKI